MSIFKTKEVRFLAKVILFLLPLIVVFGLPVAALYRSGELMSNDEVVRRHISDPRLVVGFAYSNPEYYISLQSTLQRKPQVLIIGSSLVSMFRSDFFKNPDGVYIVSPVVQVMSQFKSFLEKIPKGQSPRVLVIGLDHYFFNTDYNVVAENIDASLTEPVPTADILGNWALVYQDYLKGKFSLRELLHPQSSLIGLTALTDGSGMRYDGSHERGNVFKDSWKDPSSPQYQFHSAFSEIEKGTAHFQYGNAVWEGALQNLDALLKVAKARNIYVVGFVPPIARPIYDRLMAMPDRYGYLKGIGKSTKPIFDKYRFGFYDFMNPATLPINTDEWDDDIHMTERGAMMALIAMTKSDPVLSRYVDAAILEKKLSDTDKQFHFFQ